MPIRVHCTCGQKVTARDAFAGKFARCPACKRKLRLPAVPSATFDAFISHSHQDKPTADAACSVLESRGIRCWMAPRDIVPGKEWSEAIIDGIDQCRVMILVFSGHSNQSPQVKREVERAVSKGLVLIPFRIEDVPMTKTMQYFLSSPHWLDAITPPLEAHLQKLVATVKSSLGQPRDPPLTSSGVAPSIIPSQVTPPSPQPVPEQRGFGLRFALQLGRRRFSMSIALGAATCLALLIPAAFAPGPDLHPPSVNSVRVGADPDEMPEMQLGRAVLTDVEMQLGRAVLTDVEAQFESLDNAKRATVVWPDDVSQMIGRAVTDGDIDEVIERIGRTASVIPPFESTTKSEASATKNEKNFEKNLSVPAADEHWLMRSTIKECWRIKSPEHARAREFVYQAWPQMRQQRGAAIQQAEQALEILKDVDDHLTARKLLLVNAMHMDNLERLIESDSSERHAEVLRRLVAFQDSVQAYLEGRRASSEFLNQ